MLERPLPLRGAMDWRAVLYAAIAAGVVATLVQLLLWQLFWDVLPGILYRDARFTAAIILGRDVLPPPASITAKVFVVASLIHFTLSFVYSAVLAAAVSRCRMTSALAVGGGFGVILFVVNMYGFTLLFPWFAAARDWITLVSHIVFGVTAAACFKGLPRTP